MDYFFRLAKKNVSVPDNHESFLAYVLGLSNKKPSVGLPTIKDRDLPDIDIDFGDAQRYRVFEYIENRYGADRVARLGTVGMFQPKSAVNAVGKNLNMPLWMTRTVGEAMPTLNAGDSGYGKVLADYLPVHEAAKKPRKEFPAIKLAAQIENHPSQAGQHAAGVVVTDEPIRSYMAVDARTKATHCDKKDAEALNLLKIDALGLIQLSVFERALELAGLPPISATLEALPLDDEAAFKVMNDHKYAGVFQFTGHAVQGLAKQVVIESLEDMVALTALGRPGPLGSGGAQQWIERRNGNETIRPIHPELDAILSKTHGVVIYQETVMQIVREIGGLSWADTSAVRKAMGKSLGNEYLARYRDDFVSGATARGMDEATAKSVWDMLCTFGKYGFNRSHAVAYAIVSYWCAYLKAHFPLEFAAATLDSTADPDRQIVLLRELAEEGVGYVPVDPDKSEARWAVDKENNRLVGPLTAIKGIGPAALSTILNARETGEEISAGLVKRLERAQTDIDSLYPIRDRVKALHPDLGAIKIYTDPTPIDRIEPGEIRGEFLVIGVLSKITKKDENDKASMDRRGYAFNGPSDAVNLFVRDDVGEIFAKIDRFQFERLGVPVLERGRANKAIYAIKGSCPPDFRMIKINKMKYLGDMEE